MMQTQRIMAPRTSESLSDSTEMYTDSSDEELLTYHIVVLIEPESLLQRVYMIPTDQLLFGSTTITCLINIPPGRVGEIHDGSYNSVLLSLFFNTDYICWTNERAIRRVRRNNDRLAILTRQFINENLGKLRQYRIPNLQQAINDFPDSCFVDNVSYFIIN